METAWYLTLVNHEHPLPENHMEYPINLADLPGGPSGCASGQFSR
ncbi:hypothetical protein AALA90_12610 [Lachnospiraceae bacterium 38-10]